MLLGASLSLAFGICNLLIWFGIAIPQIYKNYRNNNSNAISYFLYYKLLIGGIISLSIALIKNTNITIIYIGIHHTIITSILISQLLYYRIKNNISLSKIETLTTIIITPITLILLTVVYMTNNKVLIEILAWFSNILFTTSKFTQIYKNYKTRSIKGLSVVSFICMIFTDLFFLISLLVNIIDMQDDLYDRLVYIIFKNIQWIISCFISLISTTIILYQFSIYPNYQNIDQNTDQNVENIEQNTNEIIEQNVEQNRLIYKKLKIIL